MPCVSLEHGNWWICYNTPYFCRSQGANKTFLIGANRPHEVFQCPAGRDRSTAGPWGAAGAAGAGRPRLRERSSAALGLPLSARSPEPPRRGRGQEGEINTKWRLTVALWHACAAPPVGRGAVSLRYRRPPGRGRGGWGAVPDFPAYRRFSCLSPISPPVLGTGGSWGERLPGRSGPRRWGTLGTAGAPCSGPAGPKVSPQGEASQIVGTLHLAIRVAHTRWRK